MMTKSSGTVRAAFLGCGRVAHHYKYILNEQHPIPDLLPVAWCDLFIDRAEEMASVFGGRSYSCFEKMLEEARPELVFILSQSGDHGKHSLIALEAGCHVISEKPLALIRAEAEYASRVADSKKLMYGGVFQNRYNPAVQKLAEAVNTGRFGKIVTSTVRLRWCRQQDYYEDGWHGTWSQDGGVINQQAIHHIDALNWICGPIESVCAISANQVNNLEAEDTMVAVLHFSNGALGTVEATTAARPEDFEASLSIVGELGMAEIGGIALNEVKCWKFVTPQPEDDIVPTKFSQSVPSGYGLGHGPLLQDIVERLSKGVIEAPISVSEALGAVDIVHALYSSIEQGGWVSLVDKPQSQRLGRSGLGIMSKRIDNDPE